jgi:DedD protein
MGLFSFFSKNKQDRTAEDSGRFYSKDDDAAIGERARSKRATNAGGASRRPGNDPMLPEKKRARRRLVGAIALALAAAVGLPMLLDSEPKPLAGDIAIQIPSKDKVAPLPVPGQQAQADGAARDKAVSAEDSVDQDEEIVSAPPAAKPQPKLESKPDLKPEASKPESKPEHKETPKPEHKEPKPEHREVPKPEHKEPKPEHKEPKPETRLADKPKAEEKVKPKAEEKLVKPVPTDAARALAILEDKAAEKAKPAEPAAQKFVLQIAALSSQEKAAEVQAKLREAGISSYTQKTTTPSGELIRVRVGPLSKDEAEKVRAKLGRLGMSGAMTPV